MIHVDRLPTEIRHGARAVLWNYEERDGKRTKVPYCPRRPDERASSTDPKTWGSFDEAYTAHLEGKSDGAGWALGDGFVGVDIDGCHDPQTGAITPEAQAIITALDSYTEVSPSGRGLHVLLHGVLPPGGRRKGKIEIYSEGRYFTITGQHLKGTPGGIEERSAQLAAIHARIFGSDGHGHRQPPAHAGFAVHEDDAAVLERARRAKNGDKFSALWGGDTSGHTSASEADLALCNLLAFWTGKDAARMDALFRQSGLMRDKWDQRHGAQTYGAMTIEKAIAACQDTYTGTQPDAPGTDQPRINAGDLELRRVSEAAWGALLAANRPPVIFRSGSLLSWIETNDENRPIVRLLTQDRLRHSLARSAEWYTTRKPKGGPVEAPALPPIHVVRDMLARPDPPLPVLARIVTAPVFARDGSLQMEPGYHPGTRCYFAPDPSLILPPLPDVPTPAEVTRAKAWLVDDLLGDFPFTGEAERAHLVAAILLPFVRELIDGATPLHLIEKPAPGTGATLLAAVATVIATGGQFAALTEGRDEDEWRKRLTAKLFTGPEVIVIDNVRRRLESAALSSAITAETWEDRLMGESQIVRLVVRCAWVATGNNPTLSGEIARRTVRIRLDAKADRPWLREGFRHPALREWAAEHRGELIWAVITLVRAWLAAGRPLSPAKLGMFERWAGVIGGILDAVGIKGFLGNLEEFYERTDVEGINWRAFVAAWWAAYADREVGVADLWSVVSPVDGEPLDLGLGDGSERSQRTRLGYRLGQMRDRQFEGKRIVQGGRFRSAQLWKLEEERPW